MGSFSDSRSRGFLYIALLFAWKTDHAPPHASSPPMCPLLGAGMAKLGPGEGKDLIVSSIPLGRMGKKWDIGMACVFLSSAAAG